jgi:tRNA-splicing ligase RtcB
VYDVAHNIAKLEEHGGKKYIIHRKGATRAFGPGRKELPKKYLETGQPVIIPGSMGTYSYVLCGTDTAMKETFGSACHGAGRRLSRIKAKKSLDYRKLKEELAAYGVTVREGSKQGLVEEAPEAYKDIEAVVEVVHLSGIAKKVAKMKPVAIIKG